MVQFSEIQTKYYQTIYQRRVDSDGKTGFITSEVGSSRDITRDKDRIERVVRVDVVNKINSKNNAMISEANSILRKVLVKNNLKQIKKENTFSAKGVNLLRIINQTYAEYSTLAYKAKKEKREFPSTPLSVFFYRYMSLQISNKSTVQKNYERILASLISHSNVTAFSLFAKFLGMFGSFDHKCFEIFIELIAQYKNIS